MIINPVIKGEGGGRLPSGIQAISCGAFTAQSTIWNTAAIIEHNLGVVPDIIVFYTDHYTIADKTPQESTSALAYTCWYNVSNAESITRKGLSLTLPATTSQNLQRNYTAIGRTDHVEAAEVTETTFGVEGSSSWEGRIYEGVEYKWVAIKLTDTN